MDQKRFRTGIRLFLIAGLAWLNWMIWQSQIDISPSVMPSAPQAQSEVHEDEELPNAAPSSLAELSETVQRPLFTQTRRPYVPQPDSSTVTQATSEVADTPVLQSESNLRVFGVMHLGGGSRKALLREAQSTTGRWVDAGNVVDGWLIRRIEDRQVVVERDGTSEVLTLHKSLAVPPQ